MDARIEKLRQDVKDAERTTHWSGRIVRAVLTLACAAPSRHSRPQLRRGVLVPQLRSDHEPVSPLGQLGDPGRPVPLWWVDSPPDRAVYVGQWAGRWLWAVLRPQSAGILLVEDLPVADLRSLGHEADLLPYGTRRPG